jgi:hypothetical protein
VAIAAEVAPDESLESYEDEVDEEDVEDMEPLLKFKRVEGNLLEVFAQDLATCLAVHARHLVRFHANSGMLRENVEWLGVLLQILGTQSGAVHVFDHGEADDQGPPTACERRMRRLERRLRSFVQ